MINFLSTPVTEKTETSNPIRVWHVIGGLALIFVVLSAFTTGG